MSSNVALKRIGAYIIDYVLITLICSALFYIPGINPREEEYNEANEKYSEIMQSYQSGDLTATEASVQISELSYDLNSNGYVYIIGDIVIIFLYYSVFVYFTRGQTLGKRIMGIKIVSNKDKPLKMTNYLIRTFILNGIIFNLLTLIAICFSKGTYETIYTIASNFDTILMIVIFLMILFYKEGRGLHDILAGTKVIDVREEENTVFEAEVKEVEQIESKEEEAKPKSVKKTTKKAAKKSKNEN